jgi:very-short-patch-repair endonuclease
MPKSERVLWAHLRGKQVHGVSFRRQVIILRYIVDFFCRSLRLVVEVDGLSHEEPHAERRDRTRERALADLGVEVLRFSSAEVLTDVDNVMRGIEGRVLDRIAEQNSEGATGR